MVLGKGTAVDALPGLVARHGKTHREVEPEHRLATRLVGQPYDSDLTDQEWAWSCLLGASPDGERVLGHPPSATFSIFVDGPPVEDAAEGVRFSIGTAMHIAVNKPALY
jgi:hypothetical protein